MTTITAVVDIDTEEVIKDIYEQKGLTWLLDELVELAGGITYLEAYIAETSYNKEEDELEELEKALVFEFFDSDNPEKRHQQQVSRVQRYRELVEMQWDKNQRRKA